MAPNLRRLLEPNAASASMHCLKVSCNAAPLSEIVAAKSGFVN
jgi:hypothetical protein